MAYRTKLLLIIALAIFNLFLYKFLLAEESASFAYDSKAKRDPFAPLFTTQVRSYASLENVETIDDLILEGILWDSKGESVAILNGVILKEGKIVNNINIIKITPSKVLLTINEEECEINLEEEKEEFK